MRWDSCKIFEKIAPLRLLAAVPILTFLTGCGESTSIDLAEKLTIGMLGVFEAPSDAEGNAEPRSMKITLQAVTMTPADGSDPIALFEDEPKEFSIINRAQIIAEAALTDYVGTVFSAITVTFAPEVTVVGKTSDELPATLSQSALQHFAPITVTKAKELRLDIRVQWKNIINRDLESDSVTETVSAPSFTFELE